MANIKLQNVFSKELIEGQIDAKNIQKEIDIINKEIEKAIEKNSSGQSILKTDSLIKRMNACIQVLSKARQELIKKEALKTKKELLQTLPEDSTELAKKQAKKDFLQAQKELEKARSSLIKEYNRKQIKLAIMEGYIIVTQLREQIIGDAIDYKIMSAGLDGDQVVLFESQPTLAEVLSSSSFDSSSFSLRLIATQEQFDKILKNSENIERISTLKNSVLSQMKRVQLDSEEHNMWERLLKVQKSRFTTGFFVYLFYIKKF